MRTCLVVLMTLASPAWAAEPEPVRVELFADAAQLAPGGSIHLGLRLIIEEDWHVYWSNPGDAGLATAMDLELQQGPSAGALLWPTPITFQQPGGIVGYGYEHEVVLARPVELPTDLRTPVTFTAEASWLACKDRCILGGATVEGQLPLPAANVASKTEVATWRESLPVPCLSDHRQFSVTPGATTTAGTTTWLTWQQTPRSVELYPDAVEGVTIKDVRVATRGGLSRLDLEVRSSRAEPLTSIPAIIVATTTNGRRRGCHLELPIGR